MTTVAIEGEDYRHGFQNPPIGWSIGTPRKRAFFGLLREVTGAA